MVIRGVSNISNVSISVSLKYQLSDLEIFIPSMPMRNSFVVLYSSPERVSSDGS